MTGRILPDLTARWPGDSAVVELPTAKGRRGRGRPGLDTAEIVRQREEGASVKQIAQNMGCTEFTVRNHLKKAANPGRRTSARHAAHVVLSKSASLPPVDHPALAEKRTLYPSTVIDPAEHPRCLIEGKNNRKISGEVQTGALKGLPIFTLTLEERATCPVTCRHWRSCYGNNMHMAKRFRAGAELEHWLPIEIAMLLRAHPQGILVRLHILGDFYSLAYVDLWRSLIETHETLHVFGFTGRIGEQDPISAALVRLTGDHWPRFGLRFSNAPEGTEHATVSIEHPFQKPDDAVICPAQTGKTDSCGTCGLCWTASKRIAFLQH